MAMDIYALLIACSDRAGLVHQITGVLFKYSLNVTENSEFVDHQAKRFFMRTQFEGSVNAGKILEEITRVLPEGAFCQVRKLEPRKIVLLASREPHCLGDVLLRFFTKELRAEVQAVLSQHENCRELTERFGLPFHYVPVNGQSREDHETRVLETIRPYAPEYLVLARYMRIFTPAFIKKFPRRMINIHHSFLPAFIGHNPYQQAYERGVKIIGATSHFVTDDLDEGPIITQDVVHVDHTCSPQEMAKLGQDVEKLVLGRGLNLVLDDRVLVDGSRTVVFE